MRIVPLFTILSTAAAIAACSSGGGGPLGPTGLDMGGHEPSSDGTFFSPYESPPGSGGSNVVSEGTGQTSDQPGNGTVTKKDGGSTVVIEAGGFDAGGGFDSGTGFDSGLGRDTGSTPTGSCADLQLCCDQLSNTSQKSSCNSVAQSGSDSSCSQALSVLTDGGYCM